MAASSAAANGSTGSSSNTKQLFTITIFSSPASNNKDNDNNNNDNNDNDNNDNQASSSSFTFVLLKSLSGQHLADAVAAAFGRSSLQGVRDSRGSLFTFDTVVQAPDLFSQGTYQLAEEEEEDEASSSLAPGSLAHVSVDQFVAAFRAFVSPQDGTLSRQQFAQCLAQLAPNTRQSDVARLFAAFDLDGNGVLDASEFVAGGVVLCGGGAQAKLRLAFRVLDVDDNGALSEQEIFKYMQAVFRVVQHTAPHAFAATTPEQLAEVTAQSAMEFAQAAPELGLTFDEFSAWMQSNDEEDEALDLEALKHATGLGELDLDELVDVMIDHATEDDGVDLAGFARALERVCAITHRDFAQVPGEQIALFFRAVDVNGDGQCDVDEITCAFSVLCAGSRDVRCAQAFRLFDADGDGFLDVHEMGKLLASVFRVMFASSSSSSGGGGLEQQVGCSADELAAITAQDALDQLDCNGDGKVSFEEFKQWYTSQQHDADEEDDEEAWLNLDSAKRITGLGAFTPALVMEAFALVADDEGMVPKLAFFDTLERLAPRDTPVDARRAKLHQKLYALFREQDERVDFSSLATALAMLTGGSELDKKRAVFELMDLDQNGTVERDEFERFMQSTMRVLFLVQPRVARELAVSADELAAVVSEDAFVKFDDNGDGRLSYGEFSAYWEVDGKADMGGSASTPPQPTLAQVREILALEQYTAEDLFELLASNSSGTNGGNISPQSFFDVVLRLATSHEERELCTNERQLVEQQIRRLYAVFDTDHDGTVDLTELAVGLSLLCGGSPDDRAEAAFRLFQSPGAQSGTISLQGMVDYLTVVFRAMHQVDAKSTASLVHAGDTPESLALETAQAVFVSADLNHDGTLSFDEWKRFYNTQDNGGGVQPVRELVEQQRVHVSIHEIKQRTGISQLLPEEVFEHFAHAADEDGELSRAAFVSVFERLAPHPHDARLHLCIDALFSLLDEDENDRVDFVELSTGLSVLAMGTKKDKLRSAFALLDMDGSGFIDHSELERYCASVYRIMFSDAGSQARVLGGLTPAELARNTADEVMLSGALEHEGRLTLDEFVRWIEAGEDAAAVATNAQVGSASDLGLGQLGELLGLHQLTTHELFALFADYASSSNELTRPAFIQAVRPQSQRAEWAAHRLFDVLDADGSGTVDWHELSAGASVLCGGDDADSKVRAAFSLYDEDGNGFIDAHEMQNYLVSVFRVTFLTQPEAVRGLDSALTPERLAAATTKEIFRTCDVNGDGQLSFEEFKQWYSSPSPLTSSRSVEAEEEDTHVEEEEKEDTPAGEAAKLTGLSSMTPNEAFALFLRFADARTGRITRTGFVRALRSLNTLGSSSTSEEAFMRASLEMHSLFDADHDGTVDLEELSVGLAMVLNPAGALLDTDSLFDLFSTGTGEYMHVRDLESMLETIFKLTLARDAEAQGIARGSSARELAKATAEAIVELADTNADGQVSRREFQRFVQSTQTGSALQHLVTQAEQDAVPANGGMAGLRQLTGLGDKTPQQVLQQVARFTRHGQRELSHEDFYQLLLLNTSASSGGSLLKLVAQKLFHALDVDLSHSLSAVELTSGLLVLCRGSKLSRAQDAFQLYDLDGDGFLSLDEVFYHLRSVFRVLQVADPAQYASVNVDDLAFSTANQVLRDADASGDGKISLDEFLSWTDAKQHNLQPVLRAGGVRTLSEARRVLHLEDVSAQELFEALAERADDEGGISRQAFAAAIQSFGAQGRDTAEMIALLFDVLDSDGSGQLDFCEVASGMSILVGGDKLDKVRAACQLFDANGDGFISRDEMLAYLTAVFSVVLATHQDAAQRLRSDGVDARKLAMATCDEAFLTADLNHDGKLDYDEFAAWVLGDAGGIATHSLVGQPKLSLDQLRRLSGLGSVAPQKLFTQLSTLADGQGFLSRHAFASALLPSAVSPVVVDTLFDLLDVNGDGSVSLSELAAGLSVLCSGSQEQKTKMAFLAFDQHGQQRLNFAQVELLLQSVFRLLLATDDAKQQQQQTGVAELAEATAQQCFDERDPERTGFVSLLDFHDFFEGGGVAA